MGKAKIVSGGPDGQYVIDIQRHVTRVTSRITVITTRLTQLETLITTAEGREATAAAAYDSANTALGLAIQAYRTGTGSADDIRKAQKDEIKARLALIEAQKIVRRLRLERESITKEKARLELVPSTERQAITWCTDLTENIEAGADVGTMEINGETIELVIIRPGGANNGLGQIQQAIASTPAGATFNLAVLPGWQKWKPTFRLGKIIELDTENDTADVALYPARSSQQGLNINIEGEAYFIEATPPGGWVDFATRYPGHPLVTNTTEETVMLTPALMDQLRQINTDVNSRKYILDQEKYAKLEHWDFMEEGGSGDCEDFAITKAQKLLDAGWPAGALILTTGVSSRGNGHAWLTVRTDQGDYGLDINYPNVILDSYFNYSDRMQLIAGTWGWNGTRINDVPVQYMTCNAAAFAVADDVVVELVGRNWTSPKVIGFKDNPKICGGNYLAFYLRDGIPQTSRVTFNPDSVGLGQTISMASLGFTGGMDKIFCHAKRFTHSVKMFDDSEVERTLYFVAMSLNLSGNTLEGGGTVEQYFNTGEPKVRWYIYDPLTGKYHKPFGYAQRMPFTELVTARGRWAGRRTGYYNYMTDTADAVNFGDLIYLGPSGYLALGETGEGDTYYETAIYQNYAYAFRLEETSPGNFGLVVKYSQMLPLIPGAPESARHCSFYVDREGLFHYSVGVGWFGIKAIDVKTGDISIIYDGMSAENYKPDYPTAGSYYSRQVYSVRIIDCDGYYDYEPLYSETQYTSAPPTTTIDYDYHSNPVGYQDYTQTATDDEPGTYHPYPETPIDPGVWVIETVTDIDSDGFQVHPMRAMIAKSVDVSFYETLVIGIDSVGHGFDFSYGQVVRGPWPPWAGENPWPNYYEEGSEYLWTHGCVIPEETLDPVANTCTPDELLTIDTIYYPEKRFPFTWFYGRVQAGDGAEIIRGLLITEVMRWSAPPSWEMTEKVYDVHRLYQGSVRKETLLAQRLGVAEDAILGLIPHPDYLDSIA